jgi:hypothetical protein
MMRIDRSLSPLRIAVLALGECEGRDYPAVKPGIAIGSIFVVTLVMGDFHRALMSGGQVPRLA